MALVNHSKREINAKIVYFGPERSGKATSLRYVHERIKPELRGELKMVPASGASLLFFDFSPFEQPVFGGYRIRLHIYTLQGRVANPAAWKMTLKGADGLVVVVDAAGEELAAGQQSMEQLREFLGGYGIGLGDLPLVLQLNKADRAGTVDGEVMALALGLPDCETCVTNALTGEGVLKTLASLSRIVVGHIGERDDLTPEQGGVEAAAAAVPDQPSCSAAVGTEPGPFAAPRQSDPQDMPAREQAPLEGLPRIAIAAGGIRVENSLIRIPLEISSAVGVQRLTVSVAVVPE